MPSSRFRAVDEAFRKMPVDVDVPESLTSDYYGCNVFNRKAMREYLSEDTRRKIYESSEQGVTLDRKTAEDVAAGMKKWAMAKGATHYTHWFQPLTGGTAEKHVSFIEPFGKGEAIEEFDGKLLCQQESDASSFPNGGLRNTFEARGYTAWDPSSPAFIIHDTLCIPTIFISYNGEALDYKAPLLRSEIAIGKAAEALLEYFGIKNDRVVSYLGWEQEYFLVDSSLFSLRPDLVMVDRTLIGHNAARNQQLEDHYLGSIPERVLAFMRDLEIECYKLGIPLKARHNEVAPNQFEVAPVYEASNLANDHNLLTMAIMKKVSEKHGFKVLFHEKPFAGVNGSGKHCNWSIGTVSGIGLFTPGKTDTENLMFLMFVANVLKAVYDNNALIKASVLTATNAHRLGANEAPPAIISTFLGAQLMQAFDDLLNSKDMVKLKGKKSYSLNIPQIPEILLDNTDRNRTSPFAFTGNRFELRAVGSSANCSNAIATLNAIVADQLVEFKKQVDARVKAGTPAMQAILDQTRETYRASMNICFDGNGYSDDWKKEAKKRGLDCETSPPKAYDILTDKRTVELYKRTGVMTKAELEARKETFCDIYSKKVEIEARILADLTANHILPIATLYETRLLDNVDKMREVFPKKEYETLSRSEIAIIKNIAEHISEVRELAIEMEATCDKANRSKTDYAKANAYHDKVLPYLDRIRSLIDDLEMIVDDEMWPLPKYRELLFIR
ncbi:glutamine synthetase [methanogenic archaeon mixed culture ISO4-G1]|nr:glutamine synthetase [methanogenic archaeon mixed culture ISO4-G1]